MDVLLIIRAATGMFLVLFLPGFALSWALYPKREDIDDITRLGYSCVLSITFSILSVLFVDIVLGVDATTEVIIATIITLTLIFTILWRAELLLFEWFPGTQGAEAPFEDSEAHAMQPLTSGLEEKQEEDRTKTHAGKPDLLPGLYTALSALKKFFRHVKKYQEKNGMFRFRGTRMPPKNEKWKIWKK